MWRTVKESLLSDLTGSFISLSCAILWIALCLKTEAGSGQAPIHYMSAVNAVVFAFFSGVKLSDHLNGHLRRMSRATIDTQHRMIMGLLAERSITDKEAP